ncbi:anti-sigma factor family protein, partial [Micrococcus luteus]|uniref:anti-sigma factor family protein n=1 Tax=Micrococcus luteus TaxID=1270 RepID=UPI00341195D5
LADTLDAATGTLLIEGKSPKRKVGELDCPETGSIGAFLLGSLDPPEQVEMERHLTSCEICRQELIEVAHLPGLMHRLTLDDVTQRASVRDLQAEPRPDLVPESDVARLLSEATTVDASFWSVFVHRLSGSRMLLLAMIIVLVLATGGVASAELLTHQPSPGVLTWTSTDTAGGIDTVARLADQSWGTDIRLWMDDLPPGLTCRLVVYPRTGAAQTAGWWSTNYEARLMVPGSTSIPLSQIDRIDVIRSDKTVLATLTSTTR